MHTTLLHSSLVGILTTFLGSLLFAEFAGYWLHRLLHSDKLPFLARGHVVHHFLVYGPSQPMRSPSYQDSTNGRFSLGNVGLEWVLPFAFIFALCWALVAFLRIALMYQILALSTLLAWPVFMFSYLHDKMHVANFWMERAPAIKLWFRRARRFHDIHHHSVNDAGRMDTNFGIGLFLFDRLFRTHAKRHRPFNWRGYRQAVARYHLEDAELFSQKSCSKLLFSKAASPQLNIEDNLDEQPQETTLVSDATLTKSDPAKHSADNLGESHWRSAGCRQRS